jgi:hypothetical protein
VVEPTPAPVAPTEIVIQLADGVAVHAQPLSVATLIVADPPVASKLAAVGPSVTAHLSGLFCFTVNVRPATEIVASRAVAAVLAVTS